MSNSLSLYLQCSESCGGGVRERMVVCFDLDYNTYPEDHCGLESKPAAMEACNYQPCPEEQSEKIKTFMIPVLFTGVWVRE